MSLFKMLRSHTLTASYEREKEQNSLDVIARLSRGNVLAQNGDIMDAAELQRKSFEADHSMATLAKLKARG